MRLTAIQWNIGGGRIRQGNGDPEDPLTYDKKALGKIVAFLQKIDPDLVTLQETHADGKEVQAETISRALGLRYVAADVYDESHLEHGQKLGQAVLARWPLTDHTFELFLNPKAEGRSPSGEPWISHDKGVTACLMDLPDGTRVSVKTSHSFPYRRFRVDPLGASIRPVQKDMAAKLRPEAKAYIYQGDLNYDDFSVKAILPELFAAGVQEVLLREPTTPKGRRYDHVLYRGLKNLESKVIKDVRTDHFPVVSIFEV